MVSKRDQLFCYVNSHDTDKNKVNWNDIRNTVELDFQRLTIPLKFRKVDTKGVSSSLPRTTYVNKEITDA